MMKEDSKQKLLVAVSGFNFQREARHATLLAIEKVLGYRPLEINAIERSGYAVVKVKSKGDVKKLLAQKAVLDPAKKVVITFRKYGKRGSKIKAIELTNINAESDLVDLRTYVTEVKEAKIIREIPEKWSSVEERKVVWTLEVPDVTWAMPFRVETSRRTMVHVKDGPICLICQSEDHDQTVCPWRSAFPSIDFNYKSYN
jgi:hypothetical protein